MSKHGYNQFCPVAMACEVLEPRWTLLILCEMWSGSTRFNEIRRGVPTMSPTLLSKRLKEMELKRLITRQTDTKTGFVNYKVTEMAWELESIVHSLGQWAHRNIDSAVTLENLDVRLLMWNIRRKIDVTSLPLTKTVIQFIFPTLDKSPSNYWLIAKPGFEVDLCWTDPGFEVDLYITADLKALTSAWIGLSKLEKEISNKKIVFTGDMTLAKSIDRWLVKSSFAKVPIS